MVALALPVGKSVEASPELRVLASDNAAILRVVNRTGGRVLRPWDAAAARLFMRRRSCPANHLASGVGSPHRSHDRPVSLYVAARRIAWSRADFSRATAATGAWIRSFTTVPRSDARPTLESLRQVREQGAVQCASAPASERPVQSAAASPPPVARPAAPDPSEATGFKAAKLRARRRFDQDR